ncbi:MmgE/PrpD family protein [Achromobacter aloeverae]
MAPQSTLNRQLAGWAGTLNLCDVGPDVIHATKLRILDITGAMLGARDIELVRQVRAAAPDVVAADAVSVPGFDLRTGVGDTALLLGTMACVLEYDDSHVATGIHATSPVLAAALALGQQLDVSGEALIRAVLVGNELTCRLGLVAPGAFHRVGFHPTGVLGVFGAGYAAASLRSLDAGRIENAIGICGSLSSGIMASWEDGSSAKSLHAGWAAAAGIRAVHLANHGVSGPATVYEGRFGFYRAHVQAPDYVPDLPAATAALGERWEIQNIASRAYPCGHYIQPFIDAALWIVRNHEFDSRDIDHVVCLVADYMAPLICEPAAEKVRPATSWHARYSLPFCVAECLLKRNFTRRSLDPGDLSDPRYATLSGKVRYQIDPAATDRFKWSGEVRVILRDGAVYSHRVPHMRGTTENPMTDTEIVEKFLGNTAGVLAESKAMSIVGRLLNLESEERINSVYGRLFG